MKKEQEDKIYQQAYEDAKMLYQEKKELADSGKETKGKASVGKPARTILKIVLVAFLVYYFGKQLLAVLDSMAEPAAMLAQNAPYAIFLILLIILIIVLL